VVCFGECGKWWLVGTELVDGDVVVELVLAVELYIDLVREDFGFVCSEEVLVSLCLISGCRGH